HLLCPPDQSRGTHTQVIGSLPCVQFGTAAPRLAPLRSAARDPHGNTTLLDRAIGGARSVHEPSTRGQGSQRLPARRAALPAERWSSRPTTCDTSAARGAALS